jgi:hypothetical protein
VLVKGGDALPKIIVGNKLGMFTGYEKNVPETLVEKGLSFAANFINGKSDAENRVVAGETAVFAVVDALVREVKGREEAYDFAEALTGQLLGTAAHRFE